MGLQIMLDIGQQPRGFIAGRLDHPAVERRQGGFHECIPRYLIASLSSLFQHNEVAFWLHGDEAKAASKRFVLGHGDLFFGHVLGQARGFALTVIDDGMLNLRVDSLLRAIRGGDKTVESGHMEKEANDANAARSDFDTGYMKGNDESV